jgi:diacylglycerol kinase (ATP)
MRFSLRVRISSFRHAFRGVYVFITTEHNAWIHLGATIVVCILAAWLGVSFAEWVALIQVIGLVWVAEALNTAIEAVCDTVCPEQHPLIKRAKDVAAGAVLIASFVAVAVGVIIFFPYLSNLVL